tara:strand:- start:16414 stop:16734 length:321 start_codon:yes stop_codon:yes gene_type:complete
MAIKFKKARQKFKSYTDADKAVDKDGDGIKSNELDEALNLVLSFGLKGNLPDGDGKKLIDVLAKKSRVKVKHMMGGFEVYGDPVSLSKFLNSVVSSKPLLKFLDTK